MELNSNLDPRWVKQDHSSGTTILVETNTCLESTIINHTMSDNGGSSTEELDLSDLLEEETMLSQTDKDTASRSSNTLSSDHGEESHTKSFPTSQDQEETSETHLESALMFMEVEIPTITGLPSGIATMVLTKVGPLTEEEFTSQDIH